MYLQEVYTLALFVAFNVIQVRWEFYHAKFANYTSHYIPSSDQAIYALVVYFFVSWHTMTRKHKKFGIGDEVEPLTVAGEPDYLGSMSSLASSRQKLVPDVSWFL